MKVINEGRQEADAGEFAAVISYLPVTHGRSCIAHIIKSMCKLDNVYCNPDSACSLLYVTWASYEPLQTSVSFQPKWNVDY